MEKTRKVLDLGCGNRKYKNAIGFDIEPLDGVDVVGDINEPLPFEENEFDMVIMNNILEHVQDITPVLREVHRITKPSGKIVIMVPYYNSPLAVIDPTHKSFFSLDTIRYFTKNSSWSYYFDFEFKIIKEKIITTRLGSLIPKRFIKKFARIFGNLIEFIIWVIRPIKDN